MVNYIGNKGGQGIREFLINYIPKSKRYFSQFYGAGGFENCKLMRGSKWLCSEINPNNKKYSTPTAVIVESDYRDLIANYNYTRDDFVFSDPPYLYATRKSKSKYYKFEFTEKQHIEFIGLSNAIKARHLITHPKCELYDNLLIGYKCIEFHYMTHGGWFNDAIYINYTPNLICLFNYDCLGTNFIKRQQIKRKRNSLINKIENLTQHERKALLNELQKKNLL